MRYIKEYNQHSYWSKITSHQFYNDAIDNAIGFDSDEVRDLRKIVPGFTLKMDSSYCYNSTIYIRQNDLTVYVINKTVDEWFYLLDREFYRYYKCDQMDGLMECLKELQKNR